MSLENIIIEHARKAKEASFKALYLSTAEKKEILSQMANALSDTKENIQKENLKDLERAKVNSLSEAMIDRLRLDDSRFNSMVEGVRAIAELDDPIGQELESWSRPNGLEVVKQSVPIGVIGIIYESRPNVTADAAALCIKTSNAVILRGGSEAIYSNTAIAKALIEGGKKAAMPDGMLEFISTTDREGVRFLVEQEEYLDLIIPRGGEGLIRAVSKMSKVPVLKHYKGVCHIYVDKDADLGKAENICINAKVQRPGVCNAMETMLVDEKIADTFLKSLYPKLKEKGVKLRGDKKTLEILSCDDIELANEDDWHTEYLDLVLAVKVVSSLGEAISHINKYGSGHTDAIISENVESQNEFSRGIDTGVLVINASTRFNDGSEFGFGAEIGISTDKLHARGPVGPRGITTYKYIVRGNGQIRS